MAYLLCFSRRFIMTKTNEVVSPRGQQTRRVLRNPNYKGATSPGTMKYWRKHRDSQGRATCECCGRVEKACFHHNHDSLKSQGVLCRTCNLLEGIARAIVAKKLGVNGYRSRPCPELLKKEVLLTRAIVWVEVSLNRRNPITNVTKEKCLEILSRISMSKKPPRCKSRLFRRNYKS